MTTKVTTLHIKHVRKRANTYYYQRRVPKELVKFFNCTAYLKTLGTKDLATAVKRAAKMDAEWDALRISSNTGTLYSETYARTVAFPHDLEDLFAHGDEDSQRLEFDRLPLDQQIAWRAAQEKLTGRPREPQYMFKLTDGLHAIKPTKSRLPPKTWRKYELAVELFGDQTMVSIDRPSVSNWLDTFSVRQEGDPNYRSTNSLKISLSMLGQIYEHAQTRGHIDSTNQNPFRNHKHEHNDEESYQFMGDDILKKICVHLTPMDAFIAKVGRYHGMRLTEIFNSPIVEVEGIPCFDVVKSKTKAGIRKVPIRSCITDELVRTRSDWGTPQAFSKRFGRAKVKVVGKVRSICFHSLRVTFITLAGQAGIPEQQVAWCVGHEEGKGNTMSGKLYFKGYSIQKMRDVIEAVPLILD